jgi:3-(3-hydroxy-phenyl)propionate hydroxylase
VARDASPSSARTTAAIDIEGLVAARYDGAPGTVYLVRPDQHVSARWRRATASDLEFALARATCNATVGT